MKRCGQPARMVFVLREGKGKKKRATSFSGSVSYNVAHQRWPSLPLRNVRTHAHVASVVSPDPDGLVHCPGASEGGGHESLERAVGRARTVACGSVAAWP